MSGEFQNRVRKNLEQASPAQHPSADALNAYAEHALSSRETHDVLAHLAVCADCREIVYLAAEAEEEPATPVAALPEPRRFRWWTWALPLTAVLVVASVIFVEGPLTKRSLSDQFATSKVQTQITEPQSTDQLATKTTPATPPAKTKSEPSPAQPSLKGYVDHAPAATAERRQLPQEQKEAPLPIDGGASANAPFTVAPPPPPPAYLEKDKKAETAQLSDSTIRANESAPASQTNSVSVSAASPAAQSATSEIASPRDRDKLDENSATFGKQRADAGNAKKLAAAKAAPVARAAKPAVPTWSVDANGQVQHFVNDTWQPIAIDPAAHFLVVAVYGENIWAAGRNLALYHSPDNGAHWQRQSVPAKSPADITRIDVTDAATLILTTSTAQEFITHDSGATWSPK